MDETYLWKTQTILIYIFDWLYLCSCLIVLYFDLARYSSVYVQHSLVTAKLQIKINGYDKCIESYLR